MAAATVQCYFLSPTADAPNSRLPVLHYRNVLPLPLSEESVTEFLTQHAWEKRGCWGHIAIRHFHPNSHECYGIFTGTSTLLLGRIQADESTGLRLSVQAGDVIVLPAGTAHSSLESSPDYRYIGVYPQDCPKWRNEFGKHPAADLFAETQTVALPTADPVYGEDGPLTKLWRTEIRARL